MSQGDGSRWFHESEGSTWKPSPSPVALPPADAPGHREGLEPPQASRAPQVPVAAAPHPLLPQGSSGARCPENPGAKGGDSQRRRGLPERHRPLGPLAWETGTPPHFHLAHLISPTFNALIGADTLVK